VRVCLHRDAHGFLDEYAVIRQLLQWWIPAGYTGKALSQVTVGDKIYTWVRFDDKRLSERDVLVPTEDLRPLVEPKTALERLLEDEWLQP